MSFDLPDPSDTMAVFAAKTKQCFTDVEDLLALRLTPSNFNINETFDFNDNAITGAAYLQLTSGNTPVAAGSIYYNAGEFYLVDATNTIKLTNLGAVNVTGVKGIGGDYGNIANNAAVLYDNASGEYRFFDGTGTVHGDGVFKYISLYAQTGTNAVRLIAPTAVTATYTVTYPAAAPATNNQVPLLSSTGVMAFDKVPGWKSTAPLTITVPGSAALPTSGGTLPTYGAPGAWSFPAVSTAHVEFPVVLPVGAVITAYSVYWNKSTNTTNTIFVNFWRINATGGAAAFTGSTQQTSAANAPGAVVLGQSGLSYTTVAGEAYTMICQTSGVVAGDIVASCSVTYYIP